MLKNQIILFPLLLAVISNSIASPANQKPGGYILTGRIIGLKDSTKLFLTHVKDGKGDTLAQTISINGAFRFSGTLKLQGEPYFIKIGLDSISRATIKKTIIMVFVENKPITVEGDINDLSLMKVKVTGSGSHDEYLDYQSRQKAIFEGPDKQARDLLIKYNDGLNDTTISKMYNKKFDSIMKPALESKDSLDKAWVLSNKNSYVSPWLISTKAKENLIWAEEAYQSLTKRAKNSKYGQDFREKLVVLKRTSEGSVMANFNFKSIDGANVSLHDLIRSSRFTIVDFWATWCKPCIAGFKDLKELYQKYNEKGLSIVGCSIDKDENAWKSFLNRQKLPWQNVISTDGSARKFYGVEMIPMIFIVASDEKIVAKEVYDIDLINTIDKLFTTGSGN